MHKVRKGTIFFLYMQTNYKIFYFISFFLASQIFVLDYMLSHLYYYKELVIS